MDKISKLIEEGEKLLKSNPYDEGHDLTHHQNVWENAQDIAKNINIPYDKNTLHIASIWHDVVTTEIKDRNFKDRNKITEKTCIYLGNLMRTEELTENLIERTILAIRYHDTKSKPVNTEGKILYDADKLEMLNVNRWKRILGAIKKGSMPKIKLMLYKKFGKYWLKRLKSKYNFDYTRRLHDNKVKLLLNNQEAQTMAKELGEDLKSILSG